ncbi:MAG TPA: hypothetical protein VMH31_13005 [Methylomirabilota bacterium]|nr:hypothetical protein [Methylomirabilota bacterium]
MSTLIRMTMSTPTTGLSTLTNTIISTNTSMGTNIPTQATLNSTSIRANTVRMVIRTGWKSWNHTTTRISRKRIPSAGQRITFG